MSPSATVHNATPGLERSWYAIGLSAEIGTDPVPVRVLARPWVAVRLDGEVAVFDDRCPHRLAPPHRGEVVDGTLQCRYHGWRYAPDGGRCRPSSSARTSSMPPTSPPLEQPQHLYNEVAGASTALVRLELPLTGKTITILFSCLPESPTSTRIFKMMARDDLGGSRTRLAQAEEFEEMVLDEDLASSSPTRR